MTPEEYRKAVEIFEQLRELPEIQRASGLDAACGGSAELREQVERLLAGDRAASAGWFLKRRAIEDAARLLEPPPPKPPASGTTAGALLPGARLGPYEIVGLLGKGGMGEVYRARDSQLNRQVAIKVLPAALAGDAQYMVRFAQEAQVLASLNHPNIAAIYGIEQGALVMELVEGANLSGPLPADEAIPIARQIAAGLEAAHERGIVHRDLKPANIMITPAGVVKLLDFGLAKHSDSSAGRPGVSPDVSPLPALASTEPGVILGTAAYMSPEQARGKPADRRTDIWAFGVVLYEMLTGHQLFGRATAVDTLVSIVKETPDLDTLPSQTPPHLHRLISRCLRKDASTRLRDIGEARVLLDEPSEEFSAPAPPARPRRAWLPWAAAALGVAVAVVFASLWLRSRTNEVRTLRLSARLPDEAGFSRVSLPALSPDGRHLAFAAGKEGNWRLWIRDLDALTARPVPGTEGAFDPFWSPDSRFIGFFVPGKLKRVDTRGSPPIEICDATDGRGGTWNRDDTIVFTPGFGAPLFRVPAAGGTPAPLTGLDEASGETSHRFPWFLPDDRHYVFTARNATPEKTAIYLGDLESKNRSRLFAAASNAVYSPPGFLLFARERTLMAQVFDAKGLRTLGTPIPIAEQVDDVQGSMQSQFSASQTGVLAYYSGGDSLRSQLTWFDRSGKALGTVGPPAVMQAAAISPDGGKVVVDRLDPALGTYDLWVIDLAQGSETRLTFDPGNDMFPVWSPDGSRILFSSNRTGRFGLYQKPANGAGKEELLYTAEGVTLPTDWPGPKAVIFSHTAAGADTGIWAFDPSGGRKPFALLEGGFSHGRLSPDGHWLAYESDDSGEPKVYVQPFPDAGGKWQVSANSGSRPVWSHDGKELFYMAGDQLMAVDVKTGPQFQFGVPKTLFAVRMPPTSPFDVSRDGWRFLIPYGFDPEAENPITLVVNWDAGLRR